MTTTKLKEIARASVRCCPRIVPSLVAVRLADGYEYSARGSIPWPSRLEKRGFCYQMENGSTVGKRYASEHAARLAWTYRQLRNAVDFLRILRAMTPAEQESQAAYWLKA